MAFDSVVAAISEYFLLATCLLMLAGSVLISFKMRFVQVRLFSTLFKMLKTSFRQCSTEEGHHTILPHKALFTAMSTTLGIGTIVAPVIAINLGGPGALLGFLLTAFFGSAATYAEVNLCIQHRKKLASGAIMGGPMQYLKELLSPAVAKIYAVIGFVLMMAWSGAQANQFAAVLDSPLLGDYRISTFLSGAIIVVLVLAILAGGIKRLGAFSERLVPIMFTLYVGSSLLILIFNYAKIPGIFQDIFHSAFSPYVMANGALVGGLVSALRWGIFKGTQVTEAGVGTQTIPHSMAETNDPVAQATLAMLSTYSAGLIAFLSGCVALVTETWQDPALPLGMSMVAASFKLYFSYFGLAIVAISALLFSFSTIVGNCYNGSHCFGYLTEGKGIWYYFGLSAIVIYLSAIAEVKLVWSLCDLVLAAMVLPHMLALIIYAFKKPQEASDLEPSPSFVRSAD